MAKSDGLPDVGGALYDADILGNMYDAAARYRKAMYEARRNMSNLIKENVDKQTSTPYPVLPKEKYYGNINPNMPPIQSKEKINKANEDAKKAQQDYNLLQEAEMKQSQPSFVGPPSPFTSAKPTLSERMQVTAPEAKTQITQADVLKDMLKTPQNPNLTRKASVLAYNTGIGGGDASTVNPEVSNYFSGQLQSYGNTKKGLSDFMTRLAQIEANEGNVLDFTAGLAEEDPTSIRKEASGGAPTLTDMMKIPDDISKKAGELRGEATGLANEFDIRRATEHIGKLIAEYPTAHAALQNGTLTVAPDGSLQYDYGKIAQLSQDERNNIAEFLGKAGALGNKVYAMDPQHGGLGQKKDYRTVLSPELMKKSSPSKHRDPLSAIEEDSISLVGAEGEEIPLMGVEYKKGNESHIHPLGQFQYTVQGYGGNDPEKPEIRFNPHDNGDGTFDPTKVDKYAKQKDGTYKLLEENMFASAALHELQTSGKPWHTWVDNRRVAELPYTSSENVKNAGIWVHANAKNKGKLTVVRRTKYQKADLKSDYDKRQQKAEQIKSNNLENSGI